MVQSKTKGPRFAYLRGGQPVLKHGYDYSSVQSEFYLMLIKKECIQYHFPLPPMLNESSQSSVNKLCVINFRTPCISYFARFNFRAPFLRENSGFNFRAPLLREN